MANTTDQHAHTTSASHDSDTQRKLSGVHKKFLWGLAIMFSSWQLLHAFAHPLSSLVSRSWHVSLMMSLALGLYALRKNLSQTRIATYDYVLIALALSSGVYQWLFEADLIARAGNPIIWDLILGTYTIVLLFEVARRVLGLALPIIALLFLFYGLFGQYLSGALQHRGYDFLQIIDQLAFGTEGIYGIPTLVSTNYLFLFILFGAFLERAGMIQLFNDIALGLVGHKAGGAAKVAVLSSGLMGTISGSGVANVLTTGQFTIPLMIRHGYSRVFAGATEATASMGGQIMPPIMGAVAFIMAETLGVAYVEIVKAAALPAILYYFTAFWMVHLEAKSKGLRGLSQSECPSAWQSIRKGWFLLLPLIALVATLFSGYTPMFAGLMGLCFTLIIILGSALIAHIHPQFLRYAFWIVLGLIAASFFRYGVKPLLVAMSLTVLICLFLNNGRKTLRDLLGSLEQGALQTIPVAIACALVGIIIGILTLTGAAGSFAGYILSIGEKSLFLSLLLTMLACIVLGMGIPTIPNYIITSSIAAPALLKLGVPLIASHLFVFYFGIMADLTPPVALAAFAAASIAKENPMRIGIKAVQIAIAGFVLPYIFVYSPALLLNETSSFFEVIYSFIKVLLASSLWGACVIGHLFSPLNKLERLYCFVAAALLIATLPLTDGIGIVLATALAIWQTYRIHQMKSP